MTHRQELVILIQNGTPPLDIYEYFIQRGLRRPSILDLYHECGITMPYPLTRDEITDERRKELQELSLTG